MSPGIEIYLLILFICFYILIVKIEEIEIRDYIEIRGGTMPKNRWGLIGKRFYIKKEGAAYYRIIYWDKEKKKRIAIFKLEDSGKISIEKEQIVRSGKKHNS